MSIHNKRGNKPIPPVDTMKCPRVDGKKVKNNNRVDTIIPNIRVVFRVLHSFSTEINFCQEPLIVNDERSLRTAIVAESSSLLQGS